MNRRQALAFAASLVASKSVASREPQWRRLRDLPQALGGQFAGVHHGALIVAGGSRFQVPPWRGGQKEWSREVYVLPKPDGEWRTFRLSAPLGYGGSASHERGLLLVGGSDSKQHHRECWWLRWDRQALRMDAAPELPVPLANCSSARVGEIAYVFGGQRSPEAHTAEGVLYSLDLRQRAPAWKAEVAFPGAGRILPAMASAGERVYIAGGASLSAGSGGSAQRTYLSDAWSYHAQQGWRALPDLPHLACAAPSLGVGGVFTVLGGSDGSLDAQVQELQDRHPGFPRTIQIYSPKHNHWNIAGETPFSLVTTTAVAWHGLAVIPGGEDRPAHRSSSSWATNLKDFHNDSQ